jgi:hypothetical protein
MLIRQASRHHHHRLRTIYLELVQMCHMQEVPKV